MSCRNPLDPYAYEKEPMPFEVSKFAGGGGAAQHGVHTTPNFDIATLYAIKRARLPGSETGVVLVLDVDGLDPLPDIDAELAAKRGIGLFNEVEFFEDEEVLEALENEDADFLRDALEGAAEMLEYDSETNISDPEDYLSVFAAMKDLGNETRVFRVLADPGLVDDYDLLQELQLAQDGEAMSDWLWSLVLEQRRYFEPIDEDRLLRVLRVWEPEEWDFADIDPVVEVLWTNPDLDEDFVDQIDFHGTDLSRARAAFPGLPWSRR